MRLWTRLIGRPTPTRSKITRRLGFESLEAREVPAIVFVGGWGASSYQYASDGASGTAPVHLWVRDATKTEPVAHVDLYKNIWINSVEVPSAATKS